MVWIKNAYSLPRLELSDSLSENKAHFVTSKRYCKDKISFQVGCYGKEIFYLCFGRSKGEK